MGNPSTGNISQLSGPQQGINKLLSQLLGEGFEGFQGGQAGLAQRLLGQPIADPDKVFEGFLAPSLRSFEQTIRPQIEEGFAGRGASFSSRRGTTIANALEGIQTQAQSQFITQNVPLQQILGQIGGINQLLQPLGQFGLQGTADTFAQPSGGTQALEAGTALGSAFLGGKN